MCKPSLIQCFIVCLFAIMGVSACTENHSPYSQKTSSTPYAADLKWWKRAGSRVESGTNDSLLIVANKLYELAKLSGDSSAVAYAGLYEANYYWQNANHAEAMKKAVQCLAKAEKYKVEPVLMEIYGTIANLHKETTSYNMAFEAAGKGLDNARKHKDTAHMVSFLGLQAMFTRSLNLSKHMSGPDKSIDLNLAALRIAESSPKYERLRTRFYDNICQYYKDQRNFKKARYYGQKGVANAIKHKQQRSLTYAYSWLGQTYFYEGNQKKGLELLESAKQIATRLKEPYRVMEIYGHIYDCYIAAKDFKGAISNYTRMRSMRDSLKVLDNVKHISELQLKYETAAKDKKIALLHASAQLKALQRNAIIVVLILLIIIVSLYYVKERKGKDLLMSEQLRLSEELKSAELELLYFTDNLKQKNELIEEFKAKLENVQAQNVVDTEIMDNLVQAHIMTDESWDNFKKLFTKVNSGFFDALKKAYPNLTATDWKTLSLIKLKLSNSEMANMLGITVEGIKKSKQRLRKKMELNKDENLEQLIGDL